MSGTIIFGGTGFLGRNIAKRFLLDTNHTVIIASRTPSPYKFENLDIDTGNLVHEQCDVTNDDDIMYLFERYQPKFCVNAISSWKESATSPFEDVHKYPVKRMVNECNKYRTAFAYISGLGVDADLATQQQFKSKYLAVRCESERIVNEAHNGQRASYIFRPGAIVSDEYPLCGILQPMVPLLYQLPHVVPAPLIGDGSTKMSLISVHDISKIVVDTLVSDSTAAAADCKTIDLGDPAQTVTLQALLDAINNALYAQPANTQKLTIPVPFFVYSLTVKIASALGALGVPLDTLLPIDATQLELMKKENAMVANASEELKDFQFEDCQKLIQSAVQKYKKDNDL
eukprot:CAMPEP_0202692658 /NCGR_PEP_ID=MMETSP1385-20130828/6977_1 /ASSEMBLY_ACC=CAM_ASM_000861 /TAXON_ID=933848 /ORGANISM="Elphidium margaritaceum" /LENGTH=342 /DNA_ID=CAMNT_0049348235 /DNA_START=13 /DNA_END=1041 /DNA_ORIENTATION=+